MYVVPVDVFNHSCPTTGFMGATVEEYGIVSPVKIQDVGSSDGEFVDDLLNKYILP
jgi:hypothetical protein